MEEIPLIFLNGPSTKNTENFQQQQQQKKKKKKNHLQHCIRRRKKTIQNHLPYSRM